MNKKMSKEQKLKVAVQFYGHLRTFEKTYKSLYDNLFNLYDCDVFIHTWNELQHRTKTWYDQRSNRTKISETYKQKINSFYNPKRLLIETQDIPEKDTVLQSKIISDAVMSLTGIKYLFYSQYKVNVLRKKYQQKCDINYDYVIIIRPDIMLHNALCINDFVKQYEFINNKSADNCRFAAHNVESNAKSPIKLREICASDILYFGKPNAIDNTCNFYLKIKENDDFLIKNFSNPEGLAVKHNKDNGIETVLICYTDNYDWSKVRMENNTKPHKFRVSGIIRVAISKRRVALHILSGYLPKIIKLKLVILGKSIEVGLGKIKN